MIDLGSNLLPWGLLRQASLASNFSGGSLPSALWEKADAAEATVIFGGSPEWEAL